MKGRTSKLLAIAVVLATRAIAQPATAGNGGTAAGPSGSAQFASYGLTATQPAFGVDPVAAKPAPPMKPKALDLSPFAGAAVEAPAMAPFTVLEPSTFAFRNRDLYTRDGMAAQSFKRHPGLLVGNAFNLNRNAAYELFLEDDWRATKIDYWDMAHAMAQGGDRREGRMILDEINDEDVRMRAEEEEDAAAPAIGRFQIASAETGTKLLEAPEQTIDIPLIRKTW
jgi:hypothetical protein